MGLILNETNQTYGIQTYSTHLNIDQMPDWYATGKTYMGSREGGWSYISKPSHPVYTIEKVYTDMQKGKSLEDQIELDNEEKSKVWEWNEPEKGDGDRVVFYKVSNTNDLTTLIVKPTDVIAPT